MLDEGKLRHRHLVSEMQFSNRSIIYILLPTQNSTTLGYPRYKQSLDLHVIINVMALLILTIENSQGLSTRFSQNGLQTCKSLNKLIRLLILTLFRKKNRSGSIITQHSNKNENKIKLLDDPLKDKTLF